MEYERKFTMEWKSFSMEWNKIASMEYGKIMLHLFTFHTIPW